MLEAKLAAMPALSQEQRDAGMQAIATYVKLAEQWYAQKEIELAVEVRMQESTGPEVTGWGPFPASASALTDASRHRGEDSCAWGDPDASDQERCAVPRHRLASPRIAS